MIDTGKIALICDRNTKAFGARDRYGVCFYWVRNKTYIDALMFFRTEMPAVPVPIRVHLFGDTAEGTLACLVLETEAPQRVIDAPIGTLQKTPVRFEYRDVDILDYDENIETYDPTTFTV